MPTLVLPEIAIDTPSGRPGVLVKTDGAVQSNGSVPKLGNLTQVDRFGIPIHGKHDPQTQGNLRR